MKVSRFCTKAAAQRRPSTVRRCCCLNCVRGCSSSRTKPELGAPAAREAKEREKNNTCVNMIVAEGRLAHVHRKSPTQKSCAMQGKSEHTTEGLLRIENKKARRLRTCQKAPLKAFPKTHMRLGMLARARQARCRSQSCSSPTMSIYLLQQARRFLGQGGQH